MGKRVWFPMEPRELAPSCRWRRSCPGPVRWDDWCSSAAVVTDSAGCASRDGGPARRSPSGRGACGCPERWWLVMWGSPSL
jgi:hypothetical protein